MKLINNYIQGNEAGKLVGQLINVTIAVCGFVVIVFAIIAQVLKHTNGVNLFTQLF